MDNKLLQEIKEILLKKKETLLKASKKSDEIKDKEVGDVIDNASYSQERESLFESSNNSINMILDIEETLKKIEKGNFGICEMCGNEIQEARLKALPTSKFCIKCQEKLEIKK